MDNRRILRRLVEILPAVVGLLVGQGVVQAQTNPPASTTVSSQVDQLPHLKLVPSDATAYMYCIGSDKLLKKLAATDAGEMLSEGEFKTFFEELTRLAERRGDFSRQFKIWLDTASVDRVMVGKPVDASERVTGREQVRTFIVDAHNIELKNSLQQLRTAADSSINVRCRTDSCDISENANGRIWLARAGSENLAQSTTFRNVVTHLIADAAPDRPAENLLAMFYYDLRQNWQWGDSNTGQANPWHVLSWASIDALGGATFLRDKKLHNRYFLSTKIDKSERYGLFQKLDEVNVRDDDWLSKVPANASGFTTGAWDPTSFVASLIVLAARISDADLEEVPYAMATIDVSIVRSLLSKIGPRYLIYRVPHSRGSILPNPFDDLVLTSELEDREEFRTDLGRLIKEFGELPAMDKTSMGNVSVDVINALYFKIFVAYTEGSLVITTSAQTLKEALEHLENKKDPFIRKVPSFAESPVGTEKRGTSMCFLLFIKEKKFGQAIYDKYVPMLQQGLGLFQLEDLMWGDDGDHQVATADRGLREWLFPRGTTIAKHETTPTYLYGVTVKNGIVLDGSSPVLSFPYLWVLTHGFGGPAAGGSVGLLDWLQHLVNSCESGVED